MTGQRGLLMGMMEPLAELEGEFHDWYDMEHLPSRLAVPGFLTAHRFVCVEGWPRYVAIYDLETTDVLKSPAYLAIKGIKGENSSPWSRRMGSKVHPRDRGRGGYRAIGVQIYPGSALFGEKGLSSRLLVLRFNAPSESAVPDILGGLRSLFEGRPETVQVRLFRSELGGLYYIGMVELLRPLHIAEIDVARFGQAARYLDLINVYVLYVGGK